MSDWHALARRPEVVRRSARLAAVIGTVLVLINYAHRLFAVGLSTPDLVKIGLTCRVP